jgi:hypothetical protein
MNKITISTEPVYMGYTQDIDKILNPYKGKEIEKCEIGKSLFLPEEFYVMTLYLRDEQIGNRDVYIIHPMITKQGERIGVEELANLKERNGLVFTKRKGLVFISCGYLDTKKLFVEFVLTDRDSSLEFKICAVDGAFVVDTIDTTPIVEDGQELVI